MPAKKLNAFERVIKKLGGTQSLAADALGVTKQCVSAWKRRGQFPGSAVRKINKATGISIKVLMATWSTE